jgi:ectoine hydroxylase-related dioxygenase (phytanoyl-CoA dioxygenase family)
MALGLERSSDDHAVDAIRSEGFVVLPELLSRDQVDEIKQQLAPWLQQKLMGRNDFEGFCSERVYALLSKAPAIAQIVEHPRVLEIVGRLLRPHFRLSACLAIQVHPGETPQGWHFDDGMTQLPRPRDMLGVSTIWAFDDFTQENGATEVVRGSHLWGGDQAPSVDDPRAEKVLMPAGSVVVFAGTLYHRGGAHVGASGTRLGITPQYSEGWMRQIENMPLAVPPKVAAQYSDRVQELLGYDILEPSFVGYVDGMHPKRLIDPDYSRTKKQRLEGG